MRKTKEEVFLHPDCGYHNVQAKVSRLLLRGVMLPWSYRSYGQFAEEDIYGRGRWIGWPKKIKKMKQPTER